MGRLAQSYLEDYKNGYFSFALFRLRKQSTFTARRSLTKQGRLKKVLSLLLTSSFGPVRHIPSLKLVLCSLPTAQSQSPPWRDQVFMSAVTPSSRGRRARKGGRYISCIQLPQMSIPILHLPPLQTVSQCPQAGVPSSATCHSTCVNSRTFTMTEAYLGC